MASKRHSLGQHFLHDRGVVRKFLEFAALKENERVVEIGAGPGMLTRELASLPIDLTAIEVDEELFLKLGEDLRRIGKIPPVKLIHADALEFPFDSIPSPFVVLGNLPYSISTPLIFRLMEFGKKISRMVLMIQQEVAKRIVARPGTKAYGPLSVGVQYYSEPRLLFSVSPRCFKPPPRVQSSVICLTIRDKAEVSVKNEVFFFKLVRRAFSHRRKTLKNALREAGIPLSNIEKALGETSLLHDNPSRRGETLSIGEWARLADKLFEFSTDL